MRLKNEKTILVACLRLGFDLDNLLIAPTSNES